MFFIPQFIALTVALCGYTSAQVPSRLNIPGAIPLGAFPVNDAPPPQFRNDRLQPVQPLVRIRRPQQQKQIQQHQQPQLLQPLPAPIQHHFADEAKPVNEEREDDSILQQQPFFQSAGGAGAQQSNHEQHLTETVRKVPVVQQQQQQPQAHQQQQRQLQLEKALAAQRFAAPIPEQLPSPKVAVSE